MDRYLPAIPAIALLVTICLFSACVSPLSPASQTTQVPVPNATPAIDVGVMPLETTPDWEYISFDAVRDNFAVSEVYSLSKIQKKTRILSIKGVNLDELGNARQWVFLVNKGDVNEMRVYDPSGWTVIPWSNELFGDEIDLNHVVPPGALFDQTANQSSGSAASPLQAYREIELKNGIYRLTITSESTSQVLVFDATTGAAIE
jgi:hypothetical protein